ncbi:ABC transporter ATP-binding protein [Mesoplasma syrphidae]|uniref:ABC transporter ATP-binding protein n=1 Tax=Mesoplasma syrphidae TaxID=225999 RepID=A0A2K9BYK9_9MOLU|nr:ABC transporter ATP-binding protein [Mesoplasma syrphidae]AUF83458.1 ABC transporter ATP-binding protein [Mesoplasma syrphidae]
MRNKNLDKSSLLFQKNSVVAVDFHKKFKDIDIGPFSFNIEKGKVTALLGSSGSGKSVFLNSLLGATLNYNGDIYINGKERKSSSSIENNANVGFYSQMDFSLYSISAYDFLKNMCNVMGLDMRIADSKIEYWLKKFDLWSAKDKSLNAFSWGMKNRMNLILCFIKEPEILILDEPGANLDSKWRNYVYEILKEFKEESECTIILTVHNIDEVYDIIENFVVLEKGKLVFSGTKEELNLYKKLKLSFENDISIENVEKHLNEHNILTFETNKKTSSIIVGLKKEQTFNDVQAVLNKYSTKAENIIAQTINISEIQKALKDKTLPHIPKYQPITYAENFKDNDKQIFIYEEFDEILNEPDKTYFYSLDKKTDSRETKIRKTSFELGVEINKDMNNEISKSANVDCDILKRINDIKKRLKIV